MSTPTKPGKYYTNCGIIEVKFVKEEGGLCTHESSGGGPGAWSGWFRIGDNRAPMQYEWGERLPDSPTLKAMRLVLSTIEARDDSPRTSGCGKPARCIFCASTQIPTGTGCSSSYVLEHAADCPWLRAQEKADAESPG